MQMGPESEAVVTQVPSIPSNSPHFILVRMVSMGLIISGVLLFLKIPPPKKKKKDKIVALKSMSKTIPPASVVLKENATTVTDCY